jgi:hypothetical protein
MWPTTWYCVIRPHRVLLLLGNPRMYRLDIRGPPCVTHLMTLSSYFRQQLLQTEQRNVGDSETKKGKVFCRTCSFGSIMHMLSCSTMTHRWDVASCWIQKDTWIVKQYQRVSTGSWLQASVRGPAALYQGYSDFFFVPPNTAIVPQIRPRPVPLPRMSYRHSKFVKGISLLVCI